MKIDAQALRNGDRTELLKLARGIMATRPLNKSVSPIASQFFPDDGAAIQPLDLDALVENLAGAEGVAHDRWVERMAAMGYSAVALNRPKVAGDVSLIGTGSGWTAPKPPIASGAKAAARALIAKAANPTAADTAILVETLKSVVHQLLGVSIETVDPSVLKSKLAKTIKARPDLALRLAKALGTTPDVDVSLDEIVAAGGKVTKTGSTLHISI